MHRMADQGTASFIPKSGVKTVQRPRSTKRIYLLAYISYIVFFSTLFTVAGTYVYGAIVDRSFEDLKQQLVAERQRFQVADIERVKLLDKRLSTAKTLLDQSVAPSRIFPDIESIVAANIRFTGLSYEQLPNRQFKIELSGRADDFNQIIGQQQLIKNSSILKDATVASYDYSVGEDAAASSGGVTLSFVFSDTRDLSTIAYVPAAAPTVETSLKSADNVIVTESATPAATTTNGAATP